MINYDTRTTAHLQSYTHWKILPNILKWNIRLPTVLIISERWRSVRSKFLQLANLASWMGIGNRFRSRIATIEYLSLNCIANDLFILVFTSGEKCFSKCNTIPAEDNAGSRQIETRSGLMASDEIRRKLWYARDHEIATVVRNGAQVQRSATLELGAKPTSTIAIIIMIWTMNNNIIHSDGLSCIRTFFVSYIRFKFRGVNDNYCRLVCKCFRRYLVTYKFYYNVRVFS